MACSLSPTSAALVCPPDTPAAVTHTPLDQVAGHNINDFSARARCDALAPVAQRNPDAAFTPIRQRCPRTTRITADPQRLVLGRGSAQAGAPLALASHLRQRTAAASTGQFRQGKLCAAASPNRPMATANRWLTQPDLARPAATGRAVMAMLMPGEKH